MIEEGHVGRLEELFTPDGQGALSYFYVNNKIVSNPEAMTDILRDFPELSTIEQEKVLEKLNFILEQVTTNSYALNKNQDPAILDILIDLIPNYVDNYVIFSKLLAFLDSLLKMSSTDQRSVEKSIKTLITQYYTLNGSVESKLLFGIISILKAFFNCKISLDKEPEKLIAFHGENGLEIRPSGKKEINWIFGNGMSIYFWINIENINYGRESLPKLFTFYSPGKGGIECYLSNNKIYYRIIGEKYCEPKSDSNGLCLGELEPRNWHFIGIEQEAKKGLGGILGGRSLIFHLNGNKFSFSLTPNSISSKEKMKMVFFDKIYCRTSSICVIPEQMQDTFSETLNKNKNSIDLIKYPKALIFEERQGKLYERNGFGFCPDPILHRYKEMSFENIIPLFHMHKFATKGSSFPILNELLSLFVLFLYKSPLNQLEAYKNNYLHIMKELIKELPNLDQVFNDETINTLLHIKQTITNTDLLVQYHGEFLWGFVDSKINISCKQMLLEIVKNNFTQNISYFSNVIGLDQMINLIEKLNVKTNRCCEKHYKIMLSRFEKDILEENEGSHFGENELALDYIAKIIELYIQNEKVSPEKEIYKLCRVLSYKFSPCFTLSFMGVIKRVLGGKLNEKLNSSHSKKIIEELMNKKVYLIFLHVIENSFFAEIKAECVRIIYSLFLRRSSIADQEEISYRLSKALWKISEDVESDAKISSHHNSPQKIKEIEEVHEEESPKLELTKKISKGKVLMRISSPNSDDNDSIEKSESNSNKNKASSIFKNVGPQAPQLSNRMKGGKSFSFKFMSESNIEEGENEKKSGSSKEIEGIPFEAFNENGKNDKELIDREADYETEIMEEEKTNENDVSHFRHQNNNDHLIELVIPKPKGKPKIKDLKIDTDLINGMYDMGGEGGQQIIISQEEKDQDIVKIRKLAQICLAAMRGEKFDEKKDEKEGLENKPIKQFIPPMTTSNRVLKSREQPKLLDLKLIDEEEEPESAIKAPQNIKPINTSIPSPNFGSRKSKSPTSMNSINEENLMILYNSLMENCISIPNYDLITPSIMYVFFAWIPETNFETKFLLDLSLILENDESKDKIRSFSKMPEFYDFLFELAYKALFFEDMGEKRVYVEKLEEITKKIFAFIFREDPECHDKFIFIMEWCSNKVKEYNPKCIFLTSRYIYFLIMDSIEEDIGNNSRNDKLMERNFQSFGAIILKFCQFFPKQTESDCGYDVFEDEFKRVAFKPDFEMISSMAPYFTSPWVDYLLCYKYFLLFQKYFCTEWYRKSVRIFEKYVETGNAEILEHFISVSLTQEWLALNAEQVFYLKNSLIFTLMGITKFMLIEKTLTKENECSEEANMILQTVLVVLFAESNKEKNDKLNSDFVNAFIKNCQTFCDLKTEKATIVIHLLTFIKEMALKNSFMNTSGLLDNNSLIIKESKNNQNILKSTPFIDKLMADFMQEGLFKGTEKNMDLESFKLLFQDVSPPKEEAASKIKSECYSKFFNKGKEIENKTQLYIEKLSEIMEQETERLFNTEVLIEASDREARSLFRKLWKNLRVFGTPWTHPEMKFQNNILFTKRLISYEHMEQNTFYKWRIAKQISKYRLRYLLKPILIEPGTRDHSENEESIDHFQEKVEIGLNKALIYFVKNELLLGARILSWLAPKISLNGSQNKEVKMIENKELEFKKVKLIKTLTVRSGYLSIINDKLVFINSHFKEPASHLSIAEYKLEENKQYAKIWQLDMLKEIQKRRYVNRRRALEICFIHGKSVMFEFESTSQLDDFVKKIIKLKGKECPNLIFNGNKNLDPKKDYEALGLLKRWSTYEISNFEYLMEINNLAGRSYSDLTQYPVFPWVVINFGNQIAFSDESSYRNLALPMGALGSEQRTEGFRERYENMSEIEEERFNYGTHYSSPAIIYHFMVRLSPFTEGSVLLQSGKFDFADRLFFSVADSYKNATSEYSDVRELIPEMFTLPEVYLNINKLDLGVMQNQKRVHNVELPPWARDNPYLYVAKLRKALEEFCVSKSINKWIDLIFGYKQRGEEAVKNMNCFVHLTYEDSINFEEIQDDKTEKAIETQILNFGQTPSQLFTKPHQERASLSALQIPSTICDSNVEARIYRPSKHNVHSDQLKDDKEDFNIMKQSGESIVHMRWFKDSKLIFIRKNGEMLFYKWHTAQPGASKVPFQCAIEKEKLISRISKNMPDSMEYFDPSLKTDVFPIEFLNNGSHIALGGISDGKLLIIDTDTNLVIETHLGHSHTICCVRADLKDNFLITGDISGHVIVWRILPTSPKHLVFYNEMKDHHKQITSVFISYDIRCLFTSSLDGSVFAYNIISGKKVKVFYHPDLLPVSAVVVSTNPLPVVVLFSNQESMIYCYSINGQLIQRVREKDIQRFLSPILIKDSFGFEHVAYGNDHGNTIFRKLPFLDSIINHVVAKEAAVNRMCLSKNSRFVIVGCSDGELSVITAPDLNAK